MEDGVLYHAIMVSSVLCGNGQRWLKEVVSASLDCVNIWHELTLCFILGTSGQSLCPTDPTHKN